MAIGYGPAGLLGLTPHVLAVNVVTRYVGLGPAGVASMERDFARIEGRATAAGMNVRRAMFNIGTTAGIGVGVLSATVAIHTAKAAYHFQQYTAHLRSQTALMKGEFSRMVDLSKQWAAQTGAHVEDVMQSYRIATDMGLRLAQARPFIRAATQVGLPTGTPVADVAEAMLRSRNIFQIGTDPRSANQIANVLHIGAQLGRMNVVDIIRQLPRGGAFFGMGTHGAQAGPHGGMFGLEQTVAAYAALSRNMPVSQATTQLMGLYRMIELGGRGQTRALLELYNKTGIDLTRVVSRGGLRQLGLGGVIQRVQQAHLGEHEIKDIFPQIRGESALIGLMAGGSARQAFQQILPALGTGPGAAAARARVRVQTPQEIFNTYMRTTVAQTGRLREQMHLLEIAIGTNLLPVIQKFERALIPVVHTITQWVTRHPALVRGMLEWGIAIGGIAAGLRLIAIAKGPLIAVLDAMTAGRVSMMLGPMKGYGPALVGIAYGAVLVYQRVKPFRDLVNSLADALKRLGGVLAQSPIGHQLTGIGHAVQGAAGGASPFLPLALLFHNQIIGAGTSILRRTGILSPAVKEASAAEDILAAKYKRFPALAQAAEREAKAQSAAAREAAASQGLWGRGISRVTTLMGNAVTWIKSTTFYTKVYTAIQWALNASVWGFPLIFIIGALIALGAGLVVLYNKWKPFHDFVNAAWQRLKDFAGWITTKLVDGFKFVGNWIGRNWKTLILTPILAPFTLVLAAFGLMPPKWKDAGIKMITNLVTGITHYFATHNPVTYLKHKFEGLIHWLHNLKVPNPFHWNISNPFTNPFSHGGGGFVGSGTPAGLGGAFLGGAYHGGFVNSGVEGGNATMFRGMRIPTKGALLDWDYSTAMGSTVKLPGGSTAMYKYLGSYSLAGMGTAEFFQTPNGGVFAVNHLSKSLPTSFKGATFSGGSTIGLSGEPTSRQFGSGPHLCLVTDANGRTYLAKVAPEALKNAPYIGSSASGAGANIPKSITQWGPQIMNASRRTGVPPMILASMIMQESSGNPTAKSWNAAERAWDIGLLQGGPSELKKNYSFDPGKNILGGAQYLIGLYNGPAHHDWSVAIAMYNAGAGNPRAGARYSSEVRSRIQQWTSPPQHAATRPMNTSASRPHGGGGFRPMTASNSGPGYGLPPGYVQPRTEKPVALPPVPGEVRYTASGVEEMYHGAYRDDKGILHAAGWVRMHGGVAQEGDLRYTASGHLEVYHAATTRNGIPVQAGWTRVGVAPPRAGEYRYTTRGTLQQYQGARTIHGIHQAAGWVTVPPRAGTIRYTASGREEQYVPAHRVHGHMVQAGFVTVQPRAGTVRYTAAGRESRYVPAHMEHGHLVEGGWVHVPTAHEAWRAGALRRERALQPRITQAEIERSQLRRLEPRTANLMNMTVTERQAWQRAQIQIAKDTEIINLAKLQQKWIMGQLTTPQYRRDVALERRIYQQAQVTAKATATGMTTGAYQAYHIFQREECAAQNVANKHRASQVKHGAATAEHTKAMLGHLKSIDQSMKDMKGHLDPRRPNPIKPPVPHPGGLHPNAKNDSRYIGVHMPSEST